MVAQKEALDTEHCRALEALKNQVLFLVVSTLLLFNFNKRQPVYVNCFCINLSHLVG